MAAFLLTGCCLQGIHGQCGNDWALAQWSPKEDPYDPFRANAPFHLAADAWGNVYMVGYASDSLFLQSSDGSYNFQGGANEGEEQLVLSKYDREGVLLWVKGFPTNGSFFSPGVAVWHDRVAVCGAYFQPPTVPPGGHIGAFVTLLDTAGTELWTLKFPGEGMMEAYGIAFSPAGELVLTGRFSGAFDIPGAGEISACGPPDAEFTFYCTEIFALKLDPEGEVKWAVQSGSPEKSTVFFHRGQPVCIDDLGNVMLGGYFQGVLEWDELKIRSGRNGGKAPFVAKLDGETGEAIWLTGAKTVDNDYPNGGLYGLASDRSGNIYGVGYVQSNFEWDGWPLRPQGYFECLLVCLDEAGGMKWARTFGSAHPDDREWAASALISPYNTLFVGANIFPGTEFDGQFLPSFGKGDIAALEFDLSGEFLRGWTFGGPDTDFSYGGVFDADGSLLLCGNSLSPAMSFGALEMEWDLADERTNSFLFKKCLGLPAPAGPGEEGQAKLFPNPGKGVFWLEGDFGSGELEVVAANTLGQELTRQTIPLSGQKAVYGVNAGSLTPGFYFLLLSRGGQYLFSIPVLIVP